MKGSILAVAAATVTGVTAAAHRHAHADLFKRGADQASVCVPGCTTIYTTIYGEPTRMSLTHFHSHPLPRNNLAL